MYSTVSHLQNAIRTSLAKGELCRIYGDSLSACWSNLTHDSRFEAVARFAAQNHWSVDFRELGGLGLIAEFQKSNGA